MKEKPMSDTPRTDAFMEGIPIGQHPLDQYAALHGFAHTLERELSLCVAALNRVAIFAEVDGRSMTIVAYRCRLCGEGGALYGWNHATDCVLAKGGHERWIKLEDTALNRFAISRLQAMRPGPERRQSQYSGVQGAKK